MGLVCTLINYSQLTMEICRFRMPENSIPKEAAYQIINDELMLDGNPRLNLASFVTTWMEPECDKLMMAAINKNYVDMDEYPVTTELQASPFSFLSTKFTPVNISVYSTTTHSR
uniref:glutamate decarboxylase n=1 Tax=Rhizophora mucronata TaxID=61149 RepID=A0A2P2LIM4_RHIMU